MDTKKAKYILYTVILGLSAMATLRGVFFFTETDEQYAITMAYRMASGDRMFLEMWEPHQTSAFLGALLIKVYMVITGGVDGLVLYLRLASALIQLLISVFLFSTMKEYCSKKIAFVGALFYYNSVSKYTLTIDFTSMVMWFSMLMFLCLLRYYLGNKRWEGWLVFAGISTSLLVLTYPTCVMVVIPTGLGICYLCEKKEERKKVFWYIGTCFACGVCWLTYFLTKMSLQDFMYGISQMLSDSSHKVSVIQKVTGYKNDLLSVIPYAVVSIIGALIVWILFRLCKKQCSFLHVLMLSMIVQQICIYFGPSASVKFPNIFYAFLVAIGFYGYFQRERYGISRNDCVYSAVFWFGSVTALCVFIAALTASNMRFYESNEYMMIGCIAAMAYMEHSGEKKQSWGYIIGIALVLVVVVRKGYLMQHFWGVDTIFVTKQKALEGPMAGIYCRYGDGFDYNMRGLILDQYIPDGSTIMYVGIETLAYLQGEYEISNFSVISTPTIDDRLFEYWERFPEKYPEYIVWEDKIPYLFTPSDSVKEKMLQGAELLIEDEGIHIWKTVTAN